MEPRDDPFLEKLLQRKAGLTKTDDYLSKLQAKRDSLKTPRPETPGPVASHQTEIPESPEQPTFARQLGRQVGEGMASTTRRLIADAASTYGALQQLLPASPLNPKTDSGATLGQVVGAGIQQEATEQRQDTEPYQRAQRRIAETRNTPPSPLENLALEMGHRATDGVTAGGALGLLMAGKIAKETGELAKMATDGDADAAAIYVAGTMAENAPQMVATAAAAAALGPAGAIPVGTYLETSAQIGEASRDQETGQAKPLTGKAAFAAVLSGTAAGALEAFGAERVATAVMSGLRRSGLSGATLSQAAREIVQSAATEGATEPLQEVIANVGARYGWDPSRDELEGVTEAMIAGIGMGGGGAVVANVPAATRSMFSNMQTGMEATDQLERLPMPVMPEEQAAPEAPVRPQDASTGQATESSAAPEVAPPAQPRPPETAAATEAPPVETTAADQGAAGIEFSPESIDDNVPWHKLTREQRDERTYRQFSSDEYENQRVLDDKTFERAKASYSAQSISEKGSVKRPVKIGDELWVSTGGLSGAANGITLRKLIPAGTQDADALEAARARGEYGEPGLDYYTGLRVKQGKKEFVLGVERFDAIGQGELDRIGAKLAGESAPAQAPESTETPPVEPTTPAGRQSSMVIESVRPSLDALRKAKDGEAKQRSAASFRKRVEGFRQEFAEKGAATDQYDTIIAELSAIERGVEWTPPAPRPDAFQAEDDYYDWLEKNGTNPDELIDAYDAAREAADVNQEDESSDARIARWFKDNPRYRLEQSRESASGEITDHLDKRGAMRYLAAQSRNRNTDSNVRTVEQLAIDAKVTAEELYDFIRRHPKGPEAYFKERDLAGQNFAIRYKDVTGKSLTDRVLEERRNARVVTGVDETAADRMIDDIKTEGFDLESRADLDRFWTEWVEIGRAKDYLTGFPGTYTNDEYTQFEQAVRQAREAAGERTGSGEAATQPEAAAEGVSGAPTEAAGQEDVDEGPSREGTVEELRGRYQALLLARALRSKSTKETEQQRLDAEIGNLEAVIDGMLAEAEMAWGYQEARSIETQMREGIGSPVAPQAGLFGSESGTRGTSTQKQAIKKSVADAERRVKDLRSELAKASKQARERAVKEMASGALSNEQAEAYVERVETPIRKQLDRAEADLLRIMQEGARADAAVGQSETDLFMGEPMGDADPVGGAWGEAARNAADSSAPVMGSRLSVQVATKMDDEAPGQKAIGRPAIIRSYVRAVESAGSSVPIRTGRIRQKAHGIYKVREEVIRLRVADDIVTGAHEIGHAIEKAVYGWVPGTPFKGSNGLTQTMRSELYKMGKALYGNKKPAGGYIREGWAEFMRYWLLTDRAAQVAPNLHSWFQNRFLEENPELSKALANSRELSQRWLKQGAEKRAEASYVPTQTVSQKVVAALDKDRIEKKRQELMAKWVTSLQPYREVSKHFEGIAGRPLLPQADPFRTGEALQKAHHGRVEWMVTEAMINYAGNEVGGSLQEALAPLRGKKDRIQFTLYLWARRAYALWHGRAAAFGSEPGVFEPGDRVKQPPRNPGMSADDAEYLIAKFDSHRFRIAAEKVYEWQQGVLNYASYAFPEMAGRITAGDVGDFVPLQRVFDDLSNANRRLGSRGGTIQGKDPVASLEGSGRRVKDPLRVMIENASEMVRRTHERVIINQMVALSEIEGMGKFIEEVPKDRLPFTVDLDTVLDKLADMGFDVEATDSDQVLTFFTNAYTPKGVDPIVAVPDGSGGVKWYQLDEDLYSSLRALESYRLPKVFDLVFGRMNRAFRLGTTGLRPSFALILNPSRDLQAFYGQSMSSADPATMAKAWGLALRGALKETTGLGNDPWVRLFYRLGLELAQPLGQDVRATERAIRRLFEGKAVRVVDPRNWLDVARNVLQIPETATRVAELRLMAKEMGVTDPRSLTVEQMIRLSLYAKQVTTDFSSQGSVAAVWNQVAPFVTASIGGTRAFGRAFQRNPRRAVLAGMSMLAVTLSRWWRNKDEEWYRDLRARERFAYWIIPTGNGAIMIPRAHEWGVFFSAIPEAIFDAWYQREPERVKEVVGHSLTMLNPLSMPVVIQESAEQLANEDFYSGAPIVSQGQIRDPRDEQFGPYTSGIALQLGRMFDVSPRRIDHAIYGLAGGVGADVTRSFDTLMRELGVGNNEAVEREGEASDIPVVGTLFRRGGLAGTQSAAIDAFYDRLDDALTRQKSKRNPETQDERTVRLMLQDAKAALSIVATIRQQATDAKQREQLQVLSRRIAKTAVDAADGGPDAALDLRTQFSRIAPGSKSAQAEDRRMNGMSFDEAQARFEITRRNLESFVGGAFEQ